MTTRSQKFLTLFFISALSGCSNIKPTSNNTQPTTTQKNTTPAQISAVKLNTIQTLSSIIPELANHKTIIVGETHTRYSDHLNQLAIIKNLHQAWQAQGIKTAVGLEMIQQPFQSYLDDYIAGNIDEKTMLVKTEWYKRWGYDYRLYRPIFTYARKHKIPLIALNVPREITKRITQVGIKGLKPQERSQLPKTFDKSNTAYVHRLKKVFGQHSHTRNDHTSSKGFDKFLDAQLAWDEGMASRAANFLKTHFGYRMVIIAGGGHVINREGIPDRLERRIKSRPAVVLNNVHNIPKPEQGDYLLFSPEKKLPPLGKIGIAMKDTENGVKIESVSPHNAAAQARLKSGDIIKRLDNTPIKQTIDVRLWSLETQPGDQAIMIIERNQRTLSRKLTLGGIYHAAGKTRMHGTHGKTHFISPR